MRSSLPNRRQMQVTAGADASMDVLATLFVCFLLMFALSILISGGKYLVPEHSWLLINGYVTTEDTTDTDNTLDLKVMLQVDDGPWSTFTIMNHTKGFEPGLSFDSSKVGNASVIIDYGPVTAMSHKYVTRLMFLRPRFGEYRIRMERGFGWDNSYSHSAKVCIVIRHPYQLKDELGQMCKEFKPFKPLDLEHDFTYNPRQTL
ncbi:hypothetical protein [Vibrio alfacsensis]|uniref:hypothetical protein n=1 Tax=Vibrio alfacsensis TaxID=1074311 RepID=UPI0040690503